MLATIVTDVEMHNNFGKYLALVQSGQEVIVIRNEKEIGRFVPKDAMVSFLTDSLLGVLKSDMDIDLAKV